ncbi:hypothetical protein PPACK8108_LOCUS4646 [Phakopsora pachyrhizi]|uniref:GPI-anchored wall transfer protein 1 n=1 Tax=Phakopsora pachyrhizi TaxID=170000 RepID=A0AAV0AP46_PHAPC|nr:hypothetical protein PPACK8108_LOCUS4646 [Phakopsora pachyrhizi]
MMISTMDEKKLYYKSLKEEFVSDNEGCSLKELLLINLTGWVEFINTSVIFLGLTKLPTHVFPILGIVTFLSDQIWLTNLVMGTVTVILWCLLTWLDYGDVKLGRMRSDGGGYDEMMMLATGIRTEQQESDSIRKSFIQHSFKDDDGEDDLSRTLIRSDQRLEIIEEDEIRLMVTSISFKKPFLSIYRAQLMLITSIAILAVDFNSFPRRFSKTESWESHWYEHVTEYGVHWNFFFTMAVLSIFGIIIQSSLKKFNLNLIILGFTICSSKSLFFFFFFFYFYSLSRYQRTNNNLISANREGLSSIPASDKDQRPMKRFKKKFSVKDKRGKLIVVILSWMVIWSISTYCFLITAINVSLIGFHYQHLENERRNWSGRVPRIFDRINTNGYISILISIVHLI